LVRFQKNKINMDPAGEQCSRASKRKLGSELAN